jgi:hypothetical protein
MAQQKLTQPMAGSQQVSFGGFPSANQVPEGFVGRVGNPYRRQIAGSVAACQLQSVTPIGLHAIPGLARHQRGRHHFALRSQGRQLPIQHVAGGTGFITEPQVLDRFQFPNQPSNGFRSVWDKAQGSNFTVRFCHCDSNGLGVDIQTNKSYFTHRTDSPFACGSAPFVSNDSQRNPRTAKWRSVFFIFHGTTDRT